MGINIDDFKKELIKRKAKEFLDKGKVLAIDVGIWCMDHPVEFLAIVTSAGAGVTKLAHWNAVRMENHRRTVDYYDPRLGIHATAKRPLNGDEVAELIERYLNGESYALILKDMHLLKS